MIREMARRLRPNFILQSTYRIIKLLIPIGIYSVYLFKNPKLIRFTIVWLTSNLDSNRSSIKDEVPWITFEAKEWIESFLTSDMNVFEYGSGGSTLFFQKRVKFLVSVEHDRVWYQDLLDVLKEKNILNCKYLLLGSKPFSDGSKDFSDPQMFASREYPNMNFEAYVKSIDAFPDESFDLVFIDGRARPSCILRACDKIQPGGFLMLDNSERPYYRLGKEILTGWKRMDFFGPGPYSRYFWQTSIWEKPIK